MASRLIFQFSLRGRLLNVSRCAKVNRVERTAKTCLLLKSKAFSERRFPCPQLSFHLDIPHFHHKTRFNASTSYTRGYMVFPSISPFIIR